MRRISCTLAFAAVAIVAVHGCASSHGSASSLRAAAAVPSANGAPPKSPPTDATGADDEYAPRGFAARQVAWPLGVVTEIVQAVPEAWQEEAVPTFLVDPPFVTSDHIVARGWLVNDTDAPVLTYLLSAPHTLGPFLVMLGGPDVKLHPYGGPQMPEVFPAPERLTLPPHTRVPYERVVVLSRYEFPPGTKATLTWQFAFWKEPTSGTFDIVLP